MTAPRTSICAFAGAALLLSAGSASAQDFAGEFVVASSESCSESWSEEESSVQAALRVVAEDVSLQLDISQRIRGGSDGDWSANVWRPRDPIQCVWTGAASVDNEGQWTFAFTSVTSTPPGASLCPYHTVDGAFEVVCAREPAAAVTPIVLGGQTAPLSEADAQTNELLRCTGSNLPSVLADAAHADSFDADAPHTFYLAESAVATTSVRRLDGSIDELSVSLPVVVAIPQ